MASATSRFRFRGVTLDLRTGRVQRRAARLALEPRAYDVLVYLVQHAGAVVSRDAILDAVWKGVHVAPHSLTQAVLQLRQALSDDSRRPRFIETVHRRGYRFVAPVQALESPLGHASGIRRFPARTVSLIGRDELLNDLITELRLTRLLTLTGPGGVGKTQIALELARRVDRHFEDRVLVDLAMGDHERNVDRDIALALGVVDAERSSFLSLAAAAVQTRSVLLVLDNCEHVAGACRRAVQFLLEGCPALTVVATTQRRLHANGETVVRIPPLPVPEALSIGHVVDVAALAAIPAVRLFVERARASENSFKLTLENSGAVIDVCRRLDGLPLAIELAAARLGVLTVQQIAAKLDDPFRLLARRRAAHPPRHEMLSTTLEWSFAQLTAAEQELLTHCGVFTGGWTLEAAEAISDHPTAQMPSVLEGVQGLVDISLVVADTTGPESRFRLLETVRLYAKARLQKAHDSDRVRTRHLHYYERRVAAAAPQLLSTRQEAAATEIDRELGNIREALAWGLKGARHIEAGVRLATAMHHYWLFRGFIAEARQWLERAVDRGVVCSPDTLAGAQCALGVYRHQQADFAAARHVWMASLDRLAPDDARRSYTLGFLAFNLAVTGDLDAADRSAAAALALADRLGDNWLAGVALVGAGVATAIRGDPLKAASIFDNALERLRPSGERFMTTYASVNLGLQRYLADDLDAARKAFLSSLRASVEIRNRRSAAGCVEGLAYIISAEGDARWAARLMGAAHAAREVAAAPLFPQWRAAHDRTLARLKRDLGHDLVHREWTAGAETTTDHLIDDILAHEPA